MCDAYHEIFTASDFEPVKIIVEPLTTKASAGENFPFAVMKISMEKMVFVSSLNESAGLGELGRLLQSRAYKLLTKLSDLFLDGRSRKTRVRVEKAHGPEGRCMFVW